DYSFMRFYNELKSRGFVIYPGKVSQADCFRIGNIGDVNEKEILRLIETISEVIFW
ncbi:MAG: 2-aminoethylphosphonate--pyruvate transaminase, partial [Proteobacteria bacterium]|nr:2-aminoethylphosphonate--pyruvate transaminase [Pseudomonadota bacterium]